jgi:hypothetical protein
MNAVHSRSNDEADESILQGYWQLDVRVVEQDRKQQEALPAEQHLRINADQHNLRDSVRYRKRDLPEMETQSGRRIQIQINVMYGMKAPEQRHAMMQYVLEIESVIKQQYSCDDSSESREF